LATRFVGNTVKSARPPDSDLCPVLVRQSDPIEAETLDEKMPERESHQVDSRIGICRFVAQQRSPEIVQRFRRQYSTDEPSRLRHVLSDPLLLRIVQRLNLLLRLRF
jgi:hypothetical protein